MRYGSEQVLHALVEAGEVGRAQECLKLYGMPEGALQADVSDDALQQELRRCAGGAPRKLHCFLCTMFVLIA